MFKRTLPILLIAGLLLAACAAAAPTSESVERQAEPGFGGAAPPAATGAPALAEAPAEGVEQDAVSIVAQADRIVIKNASLSLLVKDAAATSAEITRLAESMGGFVVSSNVYETTFGPNNTPIKQASVSIRVPAARLDEALTRIKDMSVEVQNESVSGQDVTSEFTDLQSRLRNLKATEAKLQEIMDDAARTEDVLNVYRELVTIREQIEVIEGQIKYYAESAAFSQISIDLTPDVVAQPLDIGGWRPEGTARDAVELLIQSLQWLVDRLIYLVICGVPFALLFGLPTWLVVRGVRRRRQKASEAKAAPTELGPAG